MTPEVMNVIKQVLPMLGIFAFALLIYWIKLLMDRQKYAKQSEDHALIITQPVAGKLRFQLAPITVEGGVSLVRVPNIKGEVTSDSPTHILGEAGEFQVDYPINKTKFVQATVTGLIYYEGDTEPLSNVSDRPIVSAQLITNMADGISTSSAEAMRKSMENSAGQKLRKPGGLVWLYLLILAGVIVSTISLFMIMKGNTNIIDMLNLFKQSLGVKG